uniref:Poly (ADP-ribose) polymerase family, member 12a n=1 Tax=Malurus cyaneus samueli TaxID=2593467 RepID=A0A8C5UIU9_9PASS
TPSGDGALRKGTAAFSASETLIARFPLFLCLLQRSAGLLTLILLLGFLSYRKECKFVHNFHSDHNLHVLKQYGLENLNGDELCQLLLQNDPSLLPEVCLHYNKGDGLHGSCTFKTSCTKLHICQYFLWGQCRFGSSCKRSHDLLNPECFEKLERQGVSSENIKKLPSIYRNMYDIKNGNRSMYDVEDAKSSPCKGKYLLKTSEDVHKQQYAKKCIRTHFHLPYRWQVSDGNTWKDLKNMEQIEKAYCDPKKMRFDCFTESGTPVSVHFDVMYSDLGAVRRLSTASSVTKPPHFILTTEWVWYWRDEYGIWQEYGKRVSVDKWGDSALCEKFLQIFSINPVWKGQSRTKDKEVFLRS